MPIKITAVLALALVGLATGPAFAATCHMTVLGSPVLDDVPCSLASRAGITRVLLDDGGDVTVRRSVMSARLLGNPRLDGTRRLFRRSFGQVVASGDSDDKTCFFNREATLCVDP